jgi:hypothetical protein
MNLRLGILMFGLSLGFSQPVSTFAEDAATNSASINLTIDGVQYENVRWGRVTPATVTIFHKTGVASIPLSKLSPDLQKKFGYDPQKAAEWTALETKAQQQQTAAWHEEQHHKALDQTQPLPMGVPTDALRSTLPSGISFSVLDDRGASDPFVPFQVLKFQLSFDDPDSYQKLLQQFGKFIISGQSTVNGRPFPKSLVGNLKVQASGKSGKLLDLEWNPVTDLLPPLPGKYYVQVVLDTPAGKWITPLLTVEVSLPEKDEASLRFLIDNGGSDFFSHVIALRTRSESSLRQPPYSVIKQFIKTYPDSAINMVIVQHAEHARALDASQGPNYYLDQDREQLAEIIALAHPSMVQQLEAQKNTFNQDLLATTDAYRKQQDQKDINGMDRWIALLTKYAP